MSYDQQVDYIKRELEGYARELTNPNISPARVEQLSGVVAAKGATIDIIAAQKRAAILGGHRATQAEILSGVDGNDPVYGDNYTGEPFLASVKAWRQGDTAGNDYVKGVLGTSAATGTAIIPGNFVADLVGAIAAQNVYRRIFRVTPGVTGAGVNIPYELTAVTAALVQGAYGSNKDIRDWSFGTATATLYTIAQIADIGNQLLRQSNGAAEASARRRLGASIGITEATWITNGSGSSQPLGFFQAFLAYGDPAGFKTALSSEPRLATVGRGIGALEARGSLRENIVFVCSTTDYWEMSTEGNGTAYAGGWAVDPAGGAAAYPPITKAWGIPLYSDPNWPAAQVGTGLLIDTSDVEIYTGQEYRIDVSSEAGTRFDQNITGFRAEEEFGFNAEPYVRTGRVQKITGI